MKSVRAYSLAVTAVWLLFAGSVVAQEAAGAAHGDSLSSQQKKQPWEWTIEERIAMRLDPIRARDRVAATRRGAADREPYDVIDGHHNPELFFPVQIFHSAVKHGFLGSGQPYRDYHLKRAIELGLPGDLWEQIAVVSAPFIADLRRQRELFDRAAAENAPSIVNDAARELSGDLCIHGAAAYQKLRARFGVVFDRFLYETAMPGMSITYTSPPTEAGVRKQAGECK